MSQPPDDDFYKSSTEITELPPQEDFPQQDFMHQPGFGPGQQGFPTQGPQSQPGFGQPNPQAFSRPQNQGPISQPGFRQPGPPQGPTNQPAFEQPNARRAMEQRGPGPYNVPPQRLSDQASFGQQRPPSFPPPSGPISQPGFSSPERSQQDQYAAQLPPRSGNNLQSAGSIAPWEQQQSNPPARNPQSGASPWEQPQPNAPVNWPNLAQPQAPTKAKRSRLMLVVALIVLVLLVIGGGTFALFSRKGNSPSSTAAQPNTSTARGVTTPLATQPAGTPTASTGAFNSINTPVQAGADWVVTITSVKTTTASLIAPNPGSTYLEIYLTLKNTSSKTLTIVSIIEFTLTDASGHRYNETATDTTIRRPPDGNINANQTLNAQLAYEVPKNQHTFKLAFAYGLSSGNGSSIAWKFVV